MSYKSHYVKEIIEIRKKRNDELWHVVYRTAGGETSYDRVSEAEAIEVMEKYLTPLQT